MKYNRLILGLFGVVAAFSGCNSYVEKPQDHREQSTFEADLLSFERVSAEIFKPHCISCHGNSGGINLETYASVFRHRDAISRTVLTERSMPKGSSLPEPAEQLLAAWLRAGAPENSKKPEGAPPIPTPLEPKFSSLKKVIFEPKCLACHSGGTPQGDISFETLEMLWKSPRQPLKMEDPGDPETSLLVMSLGHQPGAKPMPYPAGSTPISGAQLDVIREWIKQGAAE